MYKQTYCRQSDVFVLSSVHIYVYLVMGEMTEKLLETIQMYNKQ